MADMIDSNQEMLTLEDIVSIAALNSGAPYPVENVINSLKAELGVTGTVPMRYGNTLFIVHKGKNRVCMFRALNADTARNFVENSMRWVTQIYDMGFDFAVTQFEDPTLVNIFKAISRRPPRQGMGYQVQKLSRGSYRVILALGPRRGDSK